MDSNTNETGMRITIDNDRMIIPDNPVIPFIEGDGIGPDIWAASKKVIAGDRKSVV